MKIKRLDFSRFGFLFFFVMFISNAHASDYRFTLGLGLGGAGITRTSSASSIVSGQVQRSEGPGVFELSVERIVTDQVILSVAHSRGFRLAPASSGVSFTGLFGRYYLAPIVWGEKKILNHTHLWEKRIQPFLGVGAGLASGLIERTGDLVPILEASGLFIGVRVGADMPLNRTGLGLRAEGALSFTGTSKSTEPSRLSMFMFGCSVFFQL